MNAQNSSGNKPKVNLTKKNKSNTFRSVIFTLLSIIFIAYCINLYGNHSIKMKEVPLSDVISRANDEHGNIKRITVSGNELEITLKDKDIPTETSRKDPSGTLYDQGLINRCADKAGDDLKKCQEKYPAINYVDPINYTEIFINILTIAVPIIIAVIFFGRLLGQAQSINKENMGFGKARAKLYGPDKKRVLFTDVAGNEAAKQDLSEVVDFLKNPKKYEKLGAKIPRGVLLAGDPGTGKTLMARAVAGEANVPFFSISGSEFAEMFVGVGASRVRDLFSKAKKNAPSIIFIDEIDAVAHKRDARGGAGREDEQTLNQILVEMDGFDNESGVIVIAATNRVDMLDKALLRPGRFDRHVDVTLPERKDRLAILEVHFKNKPTAKSVNLEALAAKTAGSSGADLANIANEAAITAARLGHKEITGADLTEAFERVAIGPERKSKVMNEKERKITAYHEAGHAVVGHVLPDSDPVHKITIIPRGHTGGVTWFLPPEDRSYKNIYELKDTLARAMGGRIAEKIIFGEDSVTTGASSDLQHVAELSKEMIIREGMGNKTRNLVYPSEATGYYTISTGKPYSEKTTELIDEEIAQFANEAAKRAEAVLKANHKVLDRVAEALLEKETLEEEDLKNIFEGSTLPDSAKLHD
ncbi:ATP-dependent zinc metalloprotease FtsH [Candidatus Nanosyncoccus nanoralicus]|uniref:ATP-dependent zinc metalloprotease FtsH n=1 Tax=Candidatus Nanosyncoccus nanoralicus TaxID=2171996 RepID=A0ABY0FMB4_9BACT|nr:ATP-dependent zinc metalloprotease FtsH [Candidatus Nanosyncoccus nanoralicus]RYC74006.1 ATP-dependent zinc metalloprotease FtsH 3 [Candidatus Nanosyncoccus nanoralicus]